MLSNPTISKYVKPLNALKASILALFLPILFCYSTHADVLITTLNDNGIVVITNSDVKKSELDLGSLRAIFAVRKKSWESKLPIKVFVLPDNNVIHQLFCKSVLKVYPYVLREQWDRLLFSGTGIPPTIVNTEKDLLAIVSATPGAIGYVTADAVATPLNSKNPQPKSSLSEPATSNK